MKALRWLIALGLALVPAISAAADQSVSARLRLVEEDAKVAVTRMDRLQREYGQRRGLIGAEDALQRYEDGVYAYLVGDHEGAALTFYTLVESEALSTPALAADSQWYLAECVFELENWNTALEAYGQIIAAGERHPYFPDAVRRTLEIQGILGDTEQFYAVYRQWILSGKVRATDAVRYTVAKSFYRTGELVRAKAMFTELSPESSFYARARYFTGAVLASEGQYADALAEFERALAAKPSAEVEELTNLAIGRLHYEMGNYAAAVAAYQRVPSSSPYFADQLYELVWTFIKQEAWADAVDSVEIFLVAFPDHQYALTMRLYQGHLHRKAEQFERALTSYEGVVETYQPIQRLTADLERSREQPATFFARLAESDTITDQALPLPAYAVDILRNTKGMSRAIANSQQLAAQAEDLRLSAEMAADIRAVLNATTDSIGTFARGRLGLRRVHDDALTLRIKLLDVELSQLETGADPTARPDIDRARAQLSGLTGSADQLQGADSDRTERYQIHEDQVSAAQQVAFRLDMELADINAELEATRRVLEAKRGQMEPAAIAEVERELSRIAAELPEQRRQSERLRSDATRRAVMAAVPRGTSTDTDTQRVTVAAALDGLHRELRSLRSRAIGAEAPTTFSRVDELWLQASDLDARAVTTMQALESAETTELKLLRDKLEEHTARVATLDTELGDTQRESLTLAEAVTRAGLGELDSRLLSTVMEADMGIVDVYWLRRTDVEQERLRLKTERAERIRELEDRFSLIREKLED